MVGVENFISVDSGGMNYDSMASGHVACIIPVVLSNLRRASLNLPSLPRLGAR